VQQFTGKENNLVLLRRDGLVCAFAYVVAIFQPCVMNPEFATFELPGITMEEVNKGQVTRCHRLAAIVAVKLEEIAVIARCNLRFNQRDGEPFHIELCENLRQN